VGREIVRRNDIIIIIFIPFPSQLHHKFTNVQFNPQYEGILQASSNDQLIARQTCAIECLATNSPVQKASARTSQIARGYARIR
jgi:hypothetical protein